MSRKRSPGGYRSAIKMAIEILSGQIAWGYYSRKKIVAELRKNSESLRIASTNYSRKRRQQEKAKKADSP
jgi:hypothetical protein